jgi:hypothetical protein
MAIWASFIEVYGAAECIANGAVEEGYDNCWGYRNIRGSAKNREKCGKKKDASWSEVICCRSQRLFNSHVEVREVV